jgi:hypothetical protein
MIYFDQVVLHSGRKVIGDLGEEGKVLPAFAASAPTCVRPSYETGIDNIGK